MRDASAFALYLAGAFFGVMSIKTIVDMVLPNKKKTDE